MIIYITKLNDALINDEDALDCEYFQSELDKAKSNGNNKRIVVLKSEEKLIQIALKNAFNRPIKRLTIKKNINGKPFFVDELRNVKFSISHSDKLLAIAFSVNEVGFDLQIEKTVKSNLLRFLNLDVEKVSKIEALKKFIELESFVKLNGYCLADVSQSKDGLKLKEIDYNSVCFSKGDFEVDGIKYFWSAASNRKEEVIIKMVELND